MSNIYFCALISILKNVPIKTIAIYKYNQILEYYILVYDAATIIANHKPYTPIYASLLMMRSYTLCHGFKMIPHP